MNELISRRKTKRVMVGDIPIGGESKITIQSMTTTKTENISLTISQIQQLEEMGCEIVRVTVPTEKAAKNLSKIIQSTSLPIVADIHFNYKLALMAVDAGVAKVRINPGNIGNEEKIQSVLFACNAANIPIRIGINAGSLEREILEKYKFPTAVGMVESAGRHIQICEEYNFTNLIVSLKSSDVNMMIQANRMFSKKFDYPLHLGVTEAGPLRSGTVKSAIGIGTLLADGIGDTIRVSLTDDSTKEVEIGQEILKSLGYPTNSVTLIACPTCGRLEVDLIDIVRKIELRLQDIKKPLKVAVMGCAVNGPGEAKEAHLGVACGRNGAMLYKDGKSVGKVCEEEILDRLIYEIKNYKINKEDR